MEIMRLNVIVISLRIFVSTVAVADTQSK